MLKYLFMPFLVSCIIAVFSVLLMMSFHLKPNGFASSIMNAVNMFMTVAIARQLSHKNFEKAGGFLYLVLLMSALVYSKNKYPETGLSWWVLFISFCGGCLALGDHASNESQFDGN